MPNSFAVLILLIWPLIGVLIFRMIKDREQAIIASLVWSYLFLPSGVGFDLPAVPPLDKQSIPALVLLLLLIFSRNQTGSIVPTGRLLWLLLVLFIGGRFITEAINSDPIYVASIVIPGSSMRDALSGIARSLLFLLPFLIGYGFLYSKAAQFKLLYTLLIGGLIYSVILLIEVRVSPQFHIWVYGFFPHSFLQQVRAGGFRPVGFLWHGLYAAFFVMTCCVTACILLRERKFAKRLQATAKIRMNLGIVAIYMLFILVLCKTLGSLVFCLFLLPCVLLLTPKMQVRIAAVLVSIAILFPVLRGNDLFPTQTILSMARSVSDKRADSLWVRFTNEDKLLERANIRPVFGWGSWGRNRIYSTTTGRDLTILDGYWIGVFGTAGWIGFLAQFGLLAVPVFKILRRYRGDEANLSPITSGLCLLLAISMVELLPNSTIFPWTWLIAGALWAHAVKTSPVEDAVASPREVLPKRPRTVL